MSKIAVIAKLQSQPGKRDELTAALQDLVDNAETEGGTLSYIMCADTADADTVWFWELYADEDSFKAHGASDTMKAVGAKLGGLVGGPPTLNILTPLAGKGL